eukprot:NODE_1132_length_2072_cov_0.463761.p2 type:complete len:274 gc:universal NODE_1132_length_2072_cov_0.463761:974-1795(+)
MLIGTIFAYSLYNLQDMQCTIDDPNEILEYGVQHVSISASKTTEFDYKLKNYSCPIDGSLFTLEHHGIQIIKLDDPFTAEKIAELRDVDAETIEKDTYDSYCDMMEKYFEKKFNEPMLCVDFQSRDTNANRQLPVFHKDIINEHFQGRRIKLDSNFVSSNVLTFKQPNTYNIWINVGDKIENHALYFIRPGQSNFGAILSNEDTLYMIPDFELMEIFHFPGMETGDAIIFDSSYYFHASIDNGIKFRRQSVEFTLKKRYPEVSDDSSDGYWSN